VWVCVLQTAAYLWLHKGDEYKDLYKGVTGARVMYELYRRISASDNVELFQVSLSTFVIILAACSVSNSFSLSNN